MLLTLTLPYISAHATSAVIEKIHADVGCLLNPGAKFLDVIVDLGAVAPHDCPPVSLYRIALQDRVWLRRLSVTRSDEVEFGRVIAHFTTGLDEPLDGVSVRAVRVSIAGILAPPHEWGGNRP